MTSPTFLRLDGPTLDAVVEMIAERNAELLRVLVREVVPGAAAATAPTFAEFAHEWWLRQCARALRESTVDTIRMCLKELYWHFGHVRLDAITADDIRDYQVTLARAKCANERIDRIVALLSRVLADAAERGVIAGNPAALKSTRLTRGDRWRLSGRRTPQEEHAAARCGADTA